MSAVVSRIIHRHDPGYFEKGGGIGKARDLFPDQALRFARGPAHVATDASFSFCFAHDQRLRQGKVKRAAVLISAS